MRLSSAFRRTLRVVHRGGLALLLLVTSACRTPPRAHVESTSSTGVSVEEARARAPEPTAQPFESVAPAKTAPPPAPAPAGLQAVIDGIAKRVPKLSWGSDAAIGVTWLPTGERFVHRPDEPRVSASTGKWFWAAAALERSPLPMVEVKAVPAFALSDNEAGRSLIELAGGADAVNVYTEQVLGIAPSALSLCVYNGGANPIRAERCHRVAQEKWGMDAFFTVDGALAFLGKVWRGDAPFDAVKRQKLLEWSLLAPPDIFLSIKKQLPKDRVVHHKRAEIPARCCGKDERWNWTSEIAIVEAPRGPYAVVISLAHAETYPNQVDATEWAACVIDHAVAGAAEPTAGCTLPGS